MKKPLKAMGVEEYAKYFHPGIVGENPTLSGPVIKVSGIHPGIWGPCNELTGDVSNLNGCTSGIRGEVSSKLFGNCSGIEGDVTGLEGDIRTFVQ